eukprot:Plantae.Rhodophyta-Purpureofilum_apyrenoidigerum.ctg4778.p1 GENE.Plantae.Rhodophyta-Purpureofilum_apyrenoidigerum.ctg4778~~Plantae.Rhodophyta-Purpureofilum_apyrenoidigerum.ctg4778.p1  ORF type:complete len:683 (+),score=76.04 Plantae.Rhodophyta-Purpureofilum_apyrenoidigerum.ctg4778:249-2051(+)
MAAEVLHLTRPIKIRGSFEDNQRGEGGHFMIAHTPYKQILHGVSFINLGRLAMLGRYPVHFHMCGVTDAPEVIGCSVQDSFQRGIVVHGTRNVRVQHNVLYNITGHGILAGEDGWEQDNYFGDNVGVYFKRIAPEKLLPDSTDHQVSGMWISNPRNVFVRNRMVASEKSGFWFEMRHKVFGASFKISGAEEIKPRFMSTIKFVRQVSHSNGEHGFRFYPERWFAPKPQKVFRIQSYRNLGRGIHMHAGSNIYIKWAQIVENAQGALDFDRQQSSMLSSSLIVGRSPLGGRCPSEPTVEFHQRRDISSTESTVIRNVIFDGFRDCSRAVVGIDADDDFFKTSPFSSATGLYACKFVDIDPQQAISIAIAVQSDHRFAETIALAIRQTSFKTVDYNGYVLPTTSFMTPQNVTCMPVQGGQICNSVCFRSVGLRIQGNLDHTKDYAVKVTRMRDRASTTVYPRKVMSGRRPYRFWASLQTGELYRLELIIPDGATIPDQLTVDVGDHNQGCRNGDIKLELLMNGFSLEAPEKYRKNTMNYASCLGRPPQDLVRWRDVCRNGYQVRLLTIPPRALPHVLNYSERGVTMITREAVAKCYPQMLCQ